MREAIIRVWLDLTPAQRIAVGMSGVLTIAVIIALVTWASRPTYAVLFSGMAPSDSSAVVEGLDKAGIPYRVSNGGTTVAVPSDQLAEARLRLAGEGLPPVSAVGFEIFDENRFPGTEFRNNVNYQRALQGELGRTIEALDEVKAARVHLALPQPHLYLEDQHPPKASVVVHLALGRRLGDSQVRAITHLVASAVDGLEPKQVTVVEASGTVLSAEGAESADGYASSQAAATARFEADLRQRLQGLLDGALGAGKAIVEVAAVLDFDQEESISDSYQPTAPDRGVAREHSAEEKYDGAGRSAAGPPGVTSNVLNPLSAVTATSSGGTFESHVQTREYQLGQQRKTVRKALGGIKRLCVSVIVDSEVPRASLAAVRQAVAAAAGIDESRGDELAVVPLSVEAGKLLAKQSEADADALHRQRMADLVRTVVENGLLLAAVLAAVGAAVWVWKRSAVAYPSLAGRRAGADDEPEATGLQPVGSVQEPEPVRPETPDALELLSSEPVMDADHVDALRELARSSPDRVAAQLQQWLRPEATEE
jgi:flagellar M-ring protein FliF